MANSELLTRLSDEADLCRNDGADDVADLLDTARVEIERLGSALREIARGEGEFNREPLIHAENTIENMKEIAVSALSEDRP